MSTPDALITRYLRDLEAATEGLPSAARADLLSDVRDHLEEVRSRGSEVEVRDALDRLGSPVEIAASACEVEGIAVDGPGAARPPAMAPTLGPPRAATAPPPGRAESTTSSSVRDTWTVLLLLLGPATLAFALGMVNRSLLLLGLVLGAAVAWSLLWTSRTWTTGEKLLGTLVWPGGFATPLVAMSMVTAVCTETVTVTGGDGGVDQITQTCEGFSLPLWAGIPTAIVVWLAPVVVARLLLHRGNQRRTGLP